MSPISDGSCGYALTANLRHNHNDDGSETMPVKSEKMQFSCDFKGCSFQAESIKELRDHKNSSHKKIPWYQNRKFQCKWCDHTTTCQVGFLIKQ